MLDFSGFFLYIEASHLESQRDQAWIRLPSSYLKPGQHHCLIFWYHMHGPDIRILSVTGKSNQWGAFGPVSVSEFLWSIHGNYYNPSTKLHSSWCHTFFYSIPSYVINYYLEIAKVRTPTGPFLLM